MNDRSTTGCHANGSRTRRSDYGKLPPTRLHRVGMDPTDQGLLTTHQRLPQH
jgi:hypothetical protein